MTKVSDIVAPYYVQQLANEKTRLVLPLLEVIELNPRKFSNPPTDNEPVSFVPMKAVEEESGHLDPSKARLWSEVRKGYTPFEEGDVIFAKITPCMENGKYALAQGLIGGRAAGSTEFHVLRPKPSLDSKYLLYYLLRIELRQSARQSMRGAAGQLRVPPIFFESLSIPLPTLDEQHRIVADIEEQLSRLEAGVAALKRIQANLKRYRAAVLEHSVIRPFQDAATGRRLSIAEMGKVVTGNTPSTVRKDFFGGDIPFFKPTDLDQSYNVRNFRESLTEAGLDIARELPAGAVLVTCIGATIGKTGLARVRCAVNQQINAVITNENVVVPEFLFWLFTSPSGQSLILSQASATTLPILNKRNFANLVISVPSLAEQREVVAKVDRRLSIVEELETQVHADLARAERLKQSILQQAFSATPSTLSSN